MERLDGPSFRTLSRFAFQSTVVAALLLTTARARAEPPGPGDIPIEWRAPSECPAASDVRASVAALLQGSSETGASPLAFRAEVIASGGRYRLQVETRSPRGSESKTVMGDSCSTLSEAFAMIVAFAVDPGFAGGLAGGPAPGASQVEVTPARARRAQFQQASGVPWSLGAVGAASAGKLPFPGLGVGAQVALGGAPRWQVSGLVWPNDEHTIAGTTLGVRVNLLELGAAGCWPWPGAPALQVCLGPQVGRMQGEGTSSVSGHSTGQSWWVALTAGMGSRVRFTQHWALRVQVDVGAPLFRPSFVIDRSPAASQEIWRPAPWFATVAIGPEVSFSSTDAERAGHDE